MRLSTRGRGLRPAPQGTDRTGRTRLTDLNRTYVHIYTYKRARVPGPWVHAPGLSPSGDAPGATPWGAPGGAMTRLGAPRTVQDRQDRFQERPRIARRGPRAAMTAKIGPRRAQERERRSQGRPKTANIGPKRSPRPPAWSQERRQTANRRSKSGPGPPPRPQIVLRLEK